MSEPTGPLLSVRGDARLTVPPDYVILSGAIELTRDAKAGAVRAAAAALDGLTADLAALGAVALSAETERSRLTWSAQSAATRPARKENEQTGNYELTGQVTATVDVMIGARDFDLLDALGTALATHESFNVRDAGWHVDWDNPAWPQVRAVAIQAAIHKGHDYAAALGGSLHTVEHIADAGLLGGGGDGSGFRFTSAVRARGMSAGGGESDAPSLDPVPQELAATIEARFTATGVSLAGR
jgi:uncharacterized protein YggE